MTVEARLMRLGTYLREVQTTNGAQLRKALAKKLYP